MRLLVLLVLGLMASACVTEVVQSCNVFDPACQQSGSGSAPPPPPQTTNIEAGMEFAHNQARATAGVGSLAHSDRLAFYADLRCLESPHEVATGTFHAGFYDDTVADGENMAQGYGGSVTRVMDGWLTSPGHRANLLTPSYTRMGMSYCFIGGQHYWIAEFGF